MNKSSKEVKKMKQIEKLAFNATNINKNPRLKKIYKNNLGIDQVM